MVHLKIQYVFSDRLDNPFYSSRWIFYSCIVTMEMGYFSKYPALFSSWYIWFIYSDKWRGNKLISIP